MYKDESGQIVPAIVSEELWDRANRILKKRSENLRSDNPSSYNNKYSYSGKIICVEHQVPYYRTSYKYRSGSIKEVWQCKLYSEKGKEGCDSPVLYTTEIDEIMRQAIDIIIENKEEIIHDLVKIYADISNNSSIQSDIASFETLIIEKNRMKDKLLQLCIDGKLSDEEFAVRNSKFNDEIDAYKRKIEELKLELEKNEKMGNSAEVLRKIITEELTFKDGFDCGITDSLLDKIEVYKTDDRNIINLKVYFKVVQDEMPFEVKRKRGKKTSVCYIQHT